MVAEGDYETDNFSITISWEESGGVVDEYRIQTNTTTQSNISTIYHNESTEVQNPRRNSYTQTMDVCITPCTVDISVDSPALFVG